MFTLYGCNKRIERIHEKLPRLILNDYESSFYDTHQQYNQQCCMNVLLAKAYKYLEGLAQEL